MDDNKVAILLEDLRAQFRTFGEGLQLLNDKVDRVEQKLNTHIEENRRNFGTNRQEHQLLMQMVKELDTEVVKMKRVK
jgi:hypothetical protein